MCLSIKSFCNIVTDMLSLANVQMVLRFFNYYWIFFSGFASCFFFFQMMRRKSVVLCCVVNMYIYVYISVHSCISPKPTLLPKHLKHSKNCRLPKYNESSRICHGKLLEEEERRSRISGIIDEKVFGRRSHRNMGNLCASRSVKVFKDREREREM